MADDVIVLNGLRGCASCSPMAGTKPYTMYDYDKRIGEYTPSAPPTAQWMWGGASRVRSFGYETTFPRGQSYPYEPSVMGSRWMNSWHKILGAPAYTSPLTGPAGRSATYPIGAETPTWDLGQIGQKLDLVANEQNIMIAREGLITQPREYLNVMTPAGDGGEGYLEMHDEGGEAPAVTMDLLLSLQGVCAGRADATPGVQLQCWMNEVRRRYEGLTPEEENVISDALFRLYRQQQEAMKEEPEMDIWGKLNITAPPKDEPDEQFVYGSQLYADENGIVVDDQGAPVVKAEGGLPSWVAPVAIGGAVLAGYFLFFRK